MNTKKQLLIAVSFILAIATIASANLANAAEWTPLVRIPGLPATGTVNLSMYLIGLYNFLLSIVGIAAVVMLIIGGMRYITAVGNPTAISDAKDIINSAIIGLILALLSWVFISAINPDVLYIKQPGSGVTDPSLAVKNLGNCWTTYTVATGACVCIDSFPAPLAATEQICQNFCKVDHCDLPPAMPCIAPVSPVDSGSFNFYSAPYNSRCQCIDQAFVAPLIGMTCQDTCAAGNCLVADARIGPAKIFIPDFATATTEQIQATRNSALLSDSLITNSIIISEHSDCQLVLEAERTSIVFNTTPPPVLYEWDLFPPYDGVRDLFGSKFEIIDCRLNLAGWWNAIEANPANCRKKTSEPSKDAWICPVRFFLTDTSGNIKEDVVYLGVEKP